MTIYLYKKTHNITGLNYLGKTTQDPFKYSGSGTYWRNHLKKHGNDITTVILKECQDPDELKTWGLYYSELWNVVESKEWANIRPENGDGGDTSLTPNYQKKKHLFSHKGENNPNYGKKILWSDEQKLAVTGEHHHAYGSKWSDEERAERESNGYYWSGKKRPEHVNKIIRKNFESQWGVDHNSGKHYYNDGVKNYLQYECPEGCVPGKLSKTPIKTNAGLKYFNDGVKNYYTESCPPGCSEGMIKTITLIVCHHCDKSVDSANYKRWHGEKCKLFSPLVTSS